MVYPSPPQRIDLSFARYPVSPKDVVVVRLIFVAVHPKKKKAEAHRSDGQNLFPVHGRLPVHSDRICEPSIMPTTPRSQLA